MRISDAQWLPCAPQQTWDALNDPEILRKCIPGCVQIDRRSDTEYWVTLHSKVAGIDANYEGELLLSDVDAPNSCTLAFEGKGNAAGLAIGTAQINMTPSNEGTRVSYTVAAMAGGKLGELPSSVLLKAGEKIIEKFFTTFMSHACSLPHLAPVPPPAPKLTGIRNHPVWSWAIAAGVILVLTGYHHFFVN
jgi:carbon monoxide dehydrogenase subunit G